MKQNLAVKIVAGYTLGSFILMEILYLGVWCRPFTEYWAVPPASSESRVCLILPKSNRLLMCVPTSPMFGCDKPSDYQCRFQPFVRYHDHLDPHARVPEVDSWPQKEGCSLRYLRCWTFHGTSKNTQAHQYLAPPNTHNPQILSAILSKYYSFNQPFGVDWTYWYIRESSTAIITANLPLTWSLLQKCFGLKSFKDYSNPYSNQNTNSRFRSTTYGRQSNKRGGTRSASQERITNVPLKIYQKREVQVTNAPVSPTRIESSEESLPLPDQLRTTVHVRGGNASSHNEETASERSVAGAVNVHVANGV